jgi:hypothetical protein
MHENPCQEIPRHFNLIEPNVESLVLDFRFLLLFIFPEVLHVDH